MGILQKASGSVATLSQSARNSCPKPLEVRNHFQKVCFGFSSQEIFHLKNKFELCQLIGQQELSFPPTWWPCSTTSPPWPSSQPPWPPSILNPSSPRPTVMGFTRASTGTRHSRTQWTRLLSCQWSPPPSITTC